MTESDVHVIKAEIKSLGRSLDNLRDEVRIGSQKACHIRSDHEQRITRVEEQNKHIKQLQWMMLTILVTQIVGIVLSVIGG